MEGKSNGLGHRQGGLRLRFDHFGRGLLESALQDDRTIDVLFDRALAHLASELRRGRTAAVLPRLAVLRSQLGDEVEVQPPAPERWESLRADARRWDVPVERVLEHALFLYLVDLDANCVTAGPAGGEE